jgi:phage-related protein (TIGR01555 family)
MQDSPFPAPGRVRRALADLRDRVRTDGWVNLLTGLGGRRDSSTAAVVCPPRYLTNQEILWLYHGSDLARRIVDLLPSEAMRLGWLTGDERLDKALRRKDVGRKFLDAWIWGRAYGRGGLLFLYADSLGPYDKAVRDEDVGPGDVVDMIPVEGIDMTAARRDQRTGEITHYYIHDTGGRAGGREIHVSRFVMFRGIRTADRVRAERDGAHLGVLQIVADMLRDTDQAWRGVMHLLQDLSQAVFKVKGLISQLANGQKAAVMDRMEIVDLSRSIARAVVIDADGEDFSHVGAANVTGIDGLINLVFQRVSGAAGVPMTKLFGIAPTGFNDGAQDRKNFQDAAEIEREEITDQAARVSRLYAASLRRDTHKVAIKWPPLWAPTPGERADLDVKQAQAAQARIQAQISEPEEEREIWVTGKPAAEVIDLSPLPEGVAGTPPAEGSDIVPGAIWIDTDDGHRLEVTRTGTDKAGRDVVYFLDRDSDFPERQWKWILPSFLERCRPETAPAPAAAPAGAPAAPAVPAPA